MLPVDIPAGSSDKACLRPWALSSWDVRWRILPRPCVGDNLTGLLTYLYLFAMVSRSANGSIQIDERVGSAAVVDII